MPPLKSVLRRLYNSSKNQRVVASQLKVSQATVAKWMAYFGIPVARPFKAPRGLKTTVQCDWCKKPVVKHRCRLRQKTHFCNKKCYGKYKAKHHVGCKAAHWKGGRKSHPRGESWTRALLRRVRKRDDHTCQRCRVTERELDRKLDVHHIRPFRLFGIKRHIEANCMSNLISYCHACHMKIERKARLIRR